MQEPTPFEEPFGSSPAPDEPESVEPVPMEPVQMGERVEIIDILRGFALLGILSVNMQFYTTPFLSMIRQEDWWPGLHDQIATFAIKLLTESKFYILFSFLFGLGISIQLTRSDARGAGFVGRHIKRMLILLVFGLLHAYLLWMGDILTTYAILGMAFTALVWLRPWVLGIIAAAIYSLPVLLACAGVVLQTLMGGENGSSDGLEQFIGLFGLPSSAEEARIYSSGTFGEIMRLRALEVLFSYPFLFLEMGPDIVTMFILGLCAGKLRIFEDLPRWRPFFRRWCWPAFAIGLAGNLAYACAHAFAEDGGVLLGFALVLGIAVGAPCLTFFYVSTFVWLTQSEAWLRTLRPIALVGRMGLTNYLLQSVICTSLFYSYGGGQFGMIGPLKGIGLTLVIYAVQIPLSMLWLSTFRFGPMEWLWRSLTYGEVQPMRLKSRSPTA